MCSLASFGGKVRSLTWMKEKQVRIELQLFVWRAEVLRDPLSKSQGSKYAPIFLNPIGVWVHLLPVSDLDKSLYLMELTTCITTLVLIQHAISHLLRISWNKIPHCLG